MEAKWELVRVTEDRKITIKNLVDSLKEDSEFSSNKKQSENVIQACKWLEQLFTETIELEEKLKAKTDLLAETAALLKKINGGESAKVPSNVHHRKEI